PRGPWGDGRAGRPRRNDHRLSWDGNALGAPHLPPSECQGLLSVPHGVRVKARGLGRWILAVSIGLLAGATHAADRHVAIIMDTSGSMASNDPPRYTMQLSQILSDLLDTGDELSVVRMPSDIFSLSCSSGPSSSLILTLNPADRTTFKRKLDGLVQYGGGTFF